MREETYTEGTVTISTKEYRDLIIDCTTAEASASEYRSKYWAEQTETKKLHEQINKLTEENKRYSRFISDGLTDKYKMWLFQAETQTNYGEV